MGIVIEEVRCEDAAATIMVIEKVPGEMVEPWRIVNLEVDSFENLTPKELRKLGRWLMTEGKRIGREYKSNGAAREGREG